MEMYIKKELERLNESFGDGGYFSENYVKSKLLQELALLIDRAQIRCKLNLQYAQVYGGDYYHQWQISKAALTRIQGRYRKLISTMSI